MQGRKRLTIVLAFTAFVFVASVIATAANRSLGGQSPDRPPFAQEADGDYLQLRDQYIAHRRGIEPGLYADPRWRTSALNTMQRQQKAVLKQEAPTTIPVWGQVGPVLVSNGQELGGSDTAISGRVTAIAVDPTNSNKVYLGTAQGGVWRSVDGGGTWTPIFDAAQSLSIGALAIAPSSPSTLYVGTGEGNFSCDSFFGVGVYRIDSADTSATLIGPLNKDGGAADVFTGRSISSILVDPTNAANIFVSSLDGLSGAGCNEGALFPTRGVYRSTNATSSAPSVTFSRLTVQPTADLAVTGMTFVNGNPNVLLAAVFGTAGTNGGIWRTANALDPVPTFTRTFAVQSDHTAFAVSGNTVLAAADENGLGGRVRESTDGGATWPTLLSAANGFCGGQCFYDITVAIDPRTSGSSLRIYLGGSAGAGSAAGMKVSNNNGASFSVDQTGLHADAHALTIDANTSPSTVWAGNDGGVWKRAADASLGSTWTNLNRGLGTVQFESLAVGKADAAFGIGGTQDNGTQLQQGHVGTWSQADFGDGGYALVDQSTTSTSNVTMYHTYFNSQNSLLGFARTNTTACAIKGGWAGRGVGFAAPGTACDGTPLGTTNGIVGSDDVEFYAPMALGPGTPNTVYYGTTRLYRSVNKGDTMTTVSQVPISGSTNPITAIGISPTNDNVRIVGLENGQVWATATGSSTLTQMTGLTAPANATGGTNKWVGRAVVDPNNADIAYVTLAYYAATGAGFNIWKTSNLSAVTPTWATAASGIPNVPVNAFVVDPLDSTHLFAGTDVGVYFSTDSGATWAPFGTGLPAVAVFDMAIVQSGTVNESLRVATHGRSMWEASLTGAKLDQTIVGFGALPDRPFNAADFNVDAPASSGLPVSFGATGNCTVTGGTVHLTGVGSCTVTASQAGNATFNAATSVPQAFAVTKANQTIAFGALAGKTFLDPDFVVSATATSGLAVSFGASGNCTNVGALVHITGAGSCTITASQAGDASYNAAVNVPQTFAIAKKGQAITFGALAAKTFGDADFTVGASASSLLAVAFGASGSCTVSGATVHVTGGGSCTITASQAGNANFDAAADVPQAFAIAKAGQAITFGALAAKTFGDADFPISASSSSGLVVGFGAAGSCTVSGATVHITGAGSCTVTASQAGNTDYNAAVDVPQTFAVAKAGQTITFGVLANKTVGAADFTLSATASSGLAVSFSASATGSCTVSGTTVHVTGAGSCTITASQAGNANFNAATNVAQSFTISAAPPPAKKCTVPKVVGKTLAAAKLALKAKHCVAGTVSRAYSRTIKKGKVVSQSRRAGRVLPAGTKVNLVVSRGRRH
jgi:hypothetical protein